MRRNRPNPESRVLSAGVILLLLSGGPVSAQGRRPTLTVLDSHVDTIGAYDFEAVDSTQPLVSYGGTASRFFKVYPAYAIATVHLPEGASVYAIEVEGCDFDDTGGQVTATLYADYLSSGSQQSVELGHAGSGFAAAFGCGIYEGEIDPAETIDNRNRTYNIVIHTDAVDENVRFTAVRLFYYLQVSPAPATATFHDVPSDDPFFQSIEAFAAAGITGGCGGGNFCPNDVVTRAQIAKFFARALGLHWSPAEAAAGARTVPDR